MKKIIIEKDQLIENVNNIKTLINSKIIAVVKGDGYGLSLLPYATILKENGIAYFAVSESYEAMFLKDHGFSDCDVLLMSVENDPNTVKELIDRDVILTVGSLQTLDTIMAIQNENKPKIHIKIDTGFGRFGFNFNEEEAIKKVFKYEVDVVGVFSHYSCSFEKEYKITKRQDDRFIHILNTIIEPNIKTDLTIHMANSCGAVLFPNENYNAVRIGSAFLGRLPMKTPVKLNKIAYLITNVLDTKTVLKGENIGYGNTYIAKEDIPIAVVGTGYKDGFGVIKANDAFRFIDILRYIFNILKSFHKKQYLHNGENEILGRIGMFSTTILNKNSLKANDEVIVDINPLYIDSSIEREYI